MSKSTLPVNLYSPWAFSVSPLTTLAHNLRQGLERCASVGVILPAGAASAVSVVSLVATDSISMPLVLAAFLLVYSSYLIDHLADVGRFTTELESARNLALAGHKRLFTTCGVGAFVGALALTTYTASPASVFLLLLFPLAVALYGTRWLGTLTVGRFGYRRLKDIPGVKAFYTAFFWGLLMVYAACFLHRGPLLQIIGFFVYMLLSFFVNTVFCDFKDLHRDRADGVATLPLLLGVPQTLRLLHGVNLGAFLWLAGFVANGWMPVGLLGLAVVHLYVAALLSYTGRTLDEGSLPGDAAMDLAFLLWLPCALIGLWMFSPLG